MPDTVIAGRAPLSIHSPATGKTLGELGLTRPTGVVMLTIVRNEKPLANLHGETRLEAGDQVVIYGPHETLDRTLDLFQPGVLPKVEGP